MALAIPTADELYQAFEAEVQARQPALTDFNEGSALDALAGGVAIEADQTIRLGLDAFAGRMIATATGADLDTTVTDKYPSLTRRAAAAAVGTLTFTRSGAGGYTIAQGTVCRATVNGVSVDFATTAPAVMPSTGTTINVAAACTATGTTGNVAVGTITSIPTPIPSDTKATVTNAARFVGGTAAETDDAYRARAQAYPLTLRRATVAALEEGALTVPGVAYVTVDESYLDTLNVVYVYVGDPDGRGNDALAALVTTELENWRVAGVHVVVLAAARQEIALAVTVTVPENGVTDALTTSCRAAVAAYVNTLAANAKLYLSAAEAAAIGVSTTILGAEATSTSAVGTTVTPSAPQNALRVTDDGLTLTLVEAS